MNRTLRQALLLVISCALIVVAGAGFTASAAQARPATRVAAPVMIALLTPPPEGEQKEGASESRELIFKTINFIILAGGLGYLLRKPLSEFFKQRSGEIEKALEEGRKALAESEARLSAVEEKLKHLEEEIGAFKSAAGKEMEGETQRRRQAVAAEVEKMLETARARMDTTTRAAKLELRFYVAEQALNQAEQMIGGRLDDASRRQLVSQFVAKLESKQHSN